MSKRMGRPPMDFNWETFDALMQFKVTLAFCSDYMNVSEDVIEKRIKQKTQENNNDIRTLCNIRFLQHILGRDNGWQVENNKKRPTNSQERKRGTLFS